MAPARTPEQIRASIEANRRELGTSMERLHQEIAVLTDWRRQLVAHQKPVVIGVAAGIFAVVGLLFLLHGFAWLAYYALPVRNQAYFWGYFLVAGLLFLLGGLAGYLAAKFLKDSSPPTPDMAIDEAGKIKKTLMFRRKKSK